MQLVFTSSSTIIHDSITKSLGYNYTKLTQPEDVFTIILTLSKTEAKIMEYSYEKSKGNNVSDIYGNGTNVDVILMYIYGQDLNVLALPSYVQ